MPQHKRLSVAVPLPHAILPVQVVEFPRRLFAPADGQRAGFSKGSAFVRWHLFRVRLADLFVQCFEDLMLFGSAGPAVVKVLCQDVRHEGQGRGLRGLEVFGVLCREGPFQLRTTEASVEALQDNITHSSVEAVGEEARAVARFMARDMWSSCVCKMKIPDPMKNAQRYLAKLPKQLHRHTVKLLVTCLAMIRSVDLAADGQDAVLHAAVVEFGYVVESVPEGCVSTADVVKTKLKGLRTVGGWCI